MKASIKDVFTKSLVASSFTFQWQNLMANDILGPGFISMSADFSITWIVRILLMRKQIVIRVKGLRNHYRRAYIDFERKQVYIYH